MPRVLFHSYHFPPIGGSGAQRPLKLARHFADHGYTPIVVTGGGATTDRWAPEDETLVQEIPAGLEVHRLERVGEPEPSSRWRGRAERWLGYPSRWADWWVGGSVELGAAVGTEVDLVYVWMQPYESARAGAELSRRLGRPWVADLGDPWALDEMRVYPSALHRRLDQRRMGQLLGTATAIVMSTPEAARRVRLAFPELEGRTIVSIPNGFDPADFKHEPRPRDDRKFRIVHTGYLHTELGLELRRTAFVRRTLRGSVRGLDILTRSHVFVIEAIRRVLERDPAAADVLELHLAGVLTEADREVAATCPVANLHGYVTHAQSIELMQTADLLFLPMHDLPAGARATIVPGKTYEYLASRSPILAAVPDGDAREILAAAGNARLCRPADVECLADAISAELARFRGGEPGDEPRADVVESYEYGSLGTRLTTVFDAVLGRSVDLAAR